MSQELLAIIDRLTNSLTKKDIQIEELSLQLKNKKEEYDNLKNKWDDFWFDLQKKQIETYEEYNKSLKEYLKVKAQIIK